MVDRVTPTLERLDEERLVVLQEEGFVLVTLLAGCQVGPECRDGGAKQSLLVRVTSVVCDQLRVDPLVRAHALPVIEPRHELAATAFGGDELHPCSSTRLLHCDATPLLETVTALRLPSFLPQDAQLLLESGECLPLVETLVGNAAEVPTPESLDLDLQLFRVVDVEVESADTTAQEVQSSKGVCLCTLDLAILGDVKPLHNTTPVLLLVAHLPVTTSTLD
ncbi:hypothetical protein PR001_g4989 [Phytophthora rubi]|nr:hypothetical protein PR001_g4989 [Phytophthora rubi]